MPRVYAGFPGRIPYYRGATGCWMLKFDKEQPQTGWWDCKFALTRASLVPTDPAARQVLLEIRSLWNRATLDLWVAHAPFAPPGTPVNGDKGVFSYTRSQLKCFKGPFTLYWEENIKREWKPPNDSYTKWAHELFLGLVYWPLHIVSPNMRDFAIQGLWPFPDAIFNFSVEELVEDNWEKTGGVLVS